jgi:hypothetical protein
MVALVQLWLPILTSAVAVFVLSSLVHMVFKWHNSDYRALPNEEEVRAIVQKNDPAPGEYLLPYCPGAETARTPEFQQKFRDGPVGMLVLRRRGAPDMGKMLGLWFLYVLAVNLVAAYLATRAFPSGAAGLGIFRLTSTVVFLAYVGGSVQNGIWMGKPWRSVAKDVLDGAIYALATGAVFYWLWPQ